MEGRATANGRRKAVNAVELCGLAGNGWDFLPLQKVAMINLETLIPNAENPRKIDKKQMERLKRSLQEFEVMMALRPMVVDETFKILGGNMRYFALKALGYKEVPDEWVKQALGLTEDQKREFIVKDNVAFGAWDFDALAGWDLGELADWGLDIPAWVVAKEIREDNYVVPDEIYTDIRIGDLIEIGPHRLLCGDATNADDVARLFNGTKPGIMVTDPPYGVEYDPSWRVKAGVNSNPKKQGKVSNDDRSDWSEAWALFPGDVAYIWHAGKYAKTVQESIEGAGFEIKAQIIWAKDRFALSRGNYHWQHEPCWYAVRNKRQAHWIGDKSQSTICEIKSREGGGLGHGTQKPVECMARPVRNHDGAVYDPFVGSGTSLIGCQQLGRVLFALDINPKYCQITINRALTFDPNLVIRVNGEPYVPPIPPEEGS